jgi:hypothetical protein
VTLEWAEIEAGTTLVAHRTGVVLRRTAPGELWFGRAMDASDQGSAESTAHLLDGAIEAAARGAAPREVPAMTPARWAWQVVGQWYCAHHSVALLPEAIARYELGGRADLADFARLKLDEEQGHDELALADLRELGYEAEAVVTAVRPPPPVLAAVDFAQSTVRDDDAVGFIGYIYALERIVRIFPPEWFAQLAAVLPAGRDGAFGFRAHALEFDVGHVDEASRFIATLPASARTKIVTACHKTAAICCQPFVHPTEAELAGWLAPFQLVADGKGYAGH